jgi:hypothetical protein
MLFKVDSAGLFLTQPPTCKTSDFAYQPHRDWAGAWKNLAFHNPALYFFPPLTPSFLKNSRKFSIILAHSQLFSN